LPGPNTQMLERGGVARLLAARREAPPALHTFAKVARLFATQGPPGLKSETLNRSGPLPR
jgi:hypothetical protein